MTRRSFIATALPAAQIARSSNPPALTPGAVRTELAAGNRRFATGRVRHPHSSRLWAARTARAGQHPHAVVLCCSDSRVAPEILFDQGLGDLFVVRVAGNVVREDETASVEYALSHLAVPFCLVLGHSACGAVQAVADAEAMPPELAHLVDPIQQSMRHVQAAGTGYSRDELIARTVRTNVVEGVAALRATSIAAQRIAAGHLRIEGAVYELSSGRVEWL